MVRERYGVDEDVCTAITPVSVFPLPVRCRSTHGRPAKETRRRVDKRAWLRQLARVAEAACSVHLSSSRHHHNPTRGSHDGTLAPLVIGYLQRPARGAVSNSPEADHDERRRGRPRSTPRTVAIAVMAMVARAAACWSIGSLNVQAQGWVAQSTSVPAWRSAPCNSLL